jgi:hypothetical protein
MWLIVAYCNKHISENCVLTPILPGWLNLRWRLSKDYEVLTHNSETMVQVAFITVLIRRLA